MAYNVNKTDGSTLATVSDGTINTTVSDITLIGRNYTGYGEILNENYVKLLENFASTSQPQRPLEGQVWWDKGGKLLQVYDGTSFKTISSSTAQATAPSSAGSIIGDTWWDTSTSQLKVFNGTTWVLVGPQFAAGTGISGTDVRTIKDSLNADHIVVFMMVGGATVAIVSKDPTFTPDPAITGFTTINPGYNLSTAVGAKIHGTAVNAEQLGGVAAATFVRNNRNESIAGSLTLNNNTGLTVGTTATARLEVSGTAAHLRNLVSNGNLLLQVNRGGTTTTALTVNGSTGRVTMPADPVDALGVATKAYVDGQISSNGFAANGDLTLQGHLLTGNTARRNIGASTARWATVFADTFNGIATSARYADLAERYAADAEYAPGTVLELGGSAEVTQCNEANSINVFGVVSSNPAYLMNSEAGTDATHPAVAMIGRVPVRVVGECKKGDRLVSAGNGCARALDAQELTGNGQIVYTILGRALEDKTSADEQLVEAAVRIQ